jgi:hypothetical protein
MQPLKMIIPGRYWDSFIYKGRLYLFGVDGAIRSIAWSDFISSWKVSVDTRIAFVCAFQRSDYLYSSEVQDLLIDPEIRTVMKGKFERLSRTQLHATEKMLMAAEKGCQDSPCPFPHADLEIYQDRLYVGSASGLFEATCNKKTKYPISTRPEKKWDGPVLGLSASYGALAMAAGREGLFELDLGYGAYNANRQNPTQLSDSSCRDCGWAYFSVFASSDSSGYFAEFSKWRDGVYNREATRHFEKVESAAQIFGSDGYCWGTQDKLCQAVANAIKVVKYEPWAPEPVKRIQEFGTVRFDPWKGEVISAATANFGVIVELENAIVVFPSEGKPVTLPGEPVNWRVFPRSRHYENQLHVIYEDHLQILSFNQDYLVNQNEKLLGTCVFSRQTRRDSISDLLLQ